MSFFRNLHLKAMAFFITLTLYVFVMTDQVMEETYVVSLKPDIPLNHVLLSDVPDVTVTITGTNRAFSRLDLNQLRELELRTFAQGAGTYQIRAADFMLPVGLTVTDVRPDEFGVSLDELVAVEVPVLPNTSGQPPDGYELRSRLVTPDTVEIIVPDSYAAEIDAIYTRQIDLAGRTTSLEEQIELVAPNRHVRFGEVRSVDVNLRIEPLIAERDIPAVPVWLTGDIQEGWDVVAVDTDVEIRVRGPQRTVVRLDPTPLFAAVDLSDLEFDGQVGIVRAPEIRNLPPDLEVLTIHPNEIRLEVRRVELPPEPTPEPIAPGPPEATGAGPP